MAHFHWESNRGTAPHPEYGRCYYCMHGDLDERMIAAEVRIELFELEFRVPDVSPANRKLSRNPREVRLAVSS